MPVRRLAAALCLSLLLAAAAHGAEERKKGGGESFTQFPTLTATLTRPDGSHGVLAVEAEVDIGDAGLRTRAKQMQPVLRDAYVQFLTRYASTLPPQSLPDADLVGRGLQQATDRVLGRQGAVMLLGSILVN